MKNRNKHFWIIALVAIMTFAFTAMSLTGCDDTSGETHNHDFSGEWHKDAVQHWKECPVDGVKGQTANHTPADGVCVCGYDNTPAHAHAFGTDWESNETQHWHECSCGDKSSPANHTWGNWQQTKAPTVTEAGEQKRTCSDCGKTETQPIGKLPACDCPNGTYHDKGDECCEGANCECETVYGYLEMVNSGGASIGKAPILKGTGYTGEMDTIIANVQAGYDALDVSDKNDLAGKIKEIRVVPTAVTETAVKDTDGKYRVSFKEDRTSAQVRSVFMSWLNSGVIQ
jgi:hypothetical protein